MKYLETEKEIILRIDKGEKLVEKIKECLGETGLRAGSISGIGALSQVSLAVFNFTTKEFEEVSREGVFEIVSLLGNVSEKDGEAYVHLHAVITDEENRCFGGHLIEGACSVTAEIIIWKIEVKISRKFNEEIGLNLLDF